jgi:hypothetical protein
LQQKGILLSFHFHDFHHDDDDGDHDHAHARGHVLDDHGEHLHDAHDLDSQF